MAHPSGTEWLDEHFGGIAKRRPAEPVAPVREPEPQPPLNQPCPKCGGFLRHEVARIICVQCGRAWGDRHVSHRERRIESSVAAQLANPIYEWVLCLAGKAGRKRPKEHE